MAEIHAVNRERHGNLRWRKPEDFSAFAKDSIVQLATYELPQAMQAGPIAFIAREETCFPAAVLGLLPDQNLFVAPDGSWLGKYLPVKYSTWPFRIGRRSEQEDFLLCINEKQASFSSFGEGDPFFDAEGKPAPVLGKILSRLLQFDNDRTASKLIYEQLIEFDLVEPWPIKVKKEDGTESEVEGLLRIREARLRELRGDALAALRDSGAIGVIYCQLLSMQNLQMLATLAAGRNRTTEPAPGFGDNGLISFDNLR